MAGASVPDHSPTTASFNVFDTVLTRRTGRPEGVFDVVAERLVAAGGLAAPAAAFAAARSRAERRLHTLQGRPPRLSEVYGEVAHVLNLPTDAVECFVETEQAVERELSVTVPGAADMIRSARASSPGGRVVFLSDTAHTGALLRELLQAQGLLVDGDRVFSSADVGASKSRGGLFTAVAAELGLPGSRFRHAGGDLRADVKAARAEGWSATHRPHALLDRYEQLLDQRPGETAALGTWLAGASRLARLRAVERGVPAALAEVAAGVTAPVLISYSLWLAAQARALGVTRLYFVARDGEVLLQVARPVLAVLAPEVECRYLYGSRQSWILAASAVADDVLSAWLAPKDDSTARTALRRAGLDVNEVWRTTRAPWADPAKADQPLSAADAVRLSGELQREPFRSAVLAAAQSDVDAALDYLRQEGFADDVRSALVDLGWRGHAARAFDALVQRVGGSAVHHLFVGLYAGVREVREAHQPPEMSAWLFDRDRVRAPDPRPLERPNVLLEMFCAGNEGRLLRYRRDGDRVVPVLERPLNVPVLEWGLQDMREVVSDVVQGCLAGLDRRHLHIDLASTCWDLLQAFWAHPTKAEAQLWGSFPWEEESFPPLYPLAEPLSHSTMLRRTFLRQRALPVNSWRAGSAALQREPWCSLLWLRSWQQQQAPLSALPRRLRRVAERRRGG